MKIEMFRIVVYMYREGYKIIRGKSNEQEVRRLVSSLDLVTNHQSGNAYLLTFLDQSLCVNEVQRIIFNVSYKDSNLQLINDSPQA